jgi:hypothetical protein
MGCSTIAACRHSPGGTLHFFQQHGGPDANPKSKDACVRVLDVPTKVTKDQGRDQRACTRALLGFQSVKISEIQDQ